MSLQYNAPKVAGRIFVQNGANQGVSTHSRPKAAGSYFIHTFFTHSFQHTAARRRLGGGTNQKMHSSRFQHTAARRRLAPPKRQAAATMRFQHTAARRRLGLYQSIYLIILCFNTQPPEGGWETLKCRGYQRHVSTHSRPKAAGITSVLLPIKPLFQHTAARRQLECDAGRRGVVAGFNTQPPEGSWRCNSRRSWRWRVSTHGRPKAAGFWIPPSNNT